MSFEWKTVAFKELCDITRGASPRPIHDYLGEEGMPWIKIADATAEPSRFISSTKEKIKQHGVRASVEVFPGDLILSNSATPGLPKFLKIRACIHDGWMLLRNFRNLDKDFAYWLLLSERLKLVAQGNGSVFTNLKTDILKSHIVTIPPIELQRKIADSLNCIDDRITLLRKTNATLEAIAQALFKSWFVDFDPVYAKIQGRAPEGMDEATAALFPDNFEESEFGTVPKGWQVEALGDACSYLNRGISPKYLEEGGILVVNQKCIRDFSVDYSKGRRHDSKQRKIDGRQLKVGDILVNSTGVGTLGRVAQVLALGEETIVDSHVTVVRAGEKLSWPYLGQWMIRQQSNIEAMGEGSTGQTELARSKLAVLPILIPSIDALSAFDDLVKSLKERIAVNETSISELAKLRDTLLPRLISGQLQIGEAEKVKA